MIDVSPRYYRGASMRLWLDVDTLLPLKKERISWDGKLQYSSEYSEFKLVDDKDFEFKDEKDMPDDPRGLMDPFGRMERPVPEDILNRRLKINQQVTMTAEGFELISIRKLPLMKLPAIHYVFSDGINTISVFHFYVTGDQSQKRIDKFVNELCIRLEKALSTPVLNKKERRNVFIVTSDMSKEDLKRIAKNISLQNTEKIREKKKEKKNSPSQ
jgi:negative regulator of sigma E activity